MENWTCPLPLRDHDRIVLGHGGGGKLTAELVEAIFLAAFDPGNTAEQLDAATVAIEGERLAFSTDSYVVRPLFFPGGCIGDLAVNGTVNDVAMSGARPTGLSASFILEEGLPIETLGLVAEAMGKASRAAGVPIVTGDTKVVEAGHGDGIYITTAGIGVIPPGVDIRPSRAAVDDVVVLSGPIGLHGMAVMSKREGLEFDSRIRTDSAPLNGLVESMIEAASDIHVLRDPTRGGLATTLCDIAKVANVGIVIEEALIPVPAEVAAACSFLGLDPMTIANEGRLVAVVPRVDADPLLEAMRAHEHGQESCVIGQVVEEHPSVVVAKTALGSMRIVDTPLGIELPRIC